MLPLPESDCTKFVGVGGWGGGAATTGVFVVPFFGMYEWLHWYCFVAFNRALCVFSVATNI